VKYTIINKASVDIKEENQAKSAEVAIYQQENQARRMKTDAREI